MRPHSRTLAALCLVLGLLSTQLLAGQPAASSDFLKAVKERFAPDTRVAVFAVAAERQGEALVLSGEVDQPAARDAAVKAAREAGHVEVIDKILVLPDPALGERHMGVVTVSVAHMRGKPAHAAELVDEALMGMPVRILKTQNGWYYAQTTVDGYLGWMEPSHIALMSADELSRWSVSPKVIATAHLGFVRDRASNDGAPVCDLVMGGTVRTSGTSGEWYAVELPDGRQGFLERSAAQREDAWRASLRAMPQAIERTARLFMGAPYLWGGTSPRGFDCSGFVKTVYRLNGIDLPRDTDQQASMGQPVAMDQDFSALRTGDLLFFAPRPPEGKPLPITHVGIYLGDKLFIHESGMVKLNSLDRASPIFSESLLSRLVAVRRVLNAPPTD
jgi:hypothetical protein